MSKFVVALGMAALGFLVWQIHPLQWSSPATEEQPLSALEVQKSKARVLEKKFQDWQRFSRVLDEIDAALVEHDIPLREAADRLYAAADRFYPEWFDIMDALHDVQGQPPVQVFARYLVYRLRLECTIYDNPRPLAWAAFQRLQREVEEMYATPIPTKSALRIDACPDQ